MRRGAGSLFYQRRPRGESRPCEREAAETFDRPGRQDLPPSLDLNPVFRLFDGTLVLSSTDISAHLACAHLEQQRLAIAREERERPEAPADAHADLVRRRGAAHEASQLSRLTEEARGEVADLTADFDVRDRRQLDDVAARTVAAMRSGVRLIFQPTFFDGRWMGRADFLRRIEISSDLGSFAYEILDSKLSRHVKPSMVHQLALYSRLAGAIQGSEPPIAHVILGDGTALPVDLRRFAALHRRVTQ